MATPLSPEQLPELAGLGDWRVQFDQLCGRFVAPGFAAAAAFVADVAAAADAADHHPDIDLRFPGIVQIVLTSHDAHGLTRRDTRLAAHISALAATASLTAAPDDVVTVRTLLDVDEPAAVRPFWQAVLGYRPGGGEAGAELLVDGRRFNAPLRVRAAGGGGTASDPQPATGHPAGPTRMEIAVAPAVVAGRVAAALAAGGSLLTDDAAHGRWVLADAAGNEVCLHTWPPDAVSPA